MELGGRTATGFEVPADVVESLNAGKRPPVTVTVNGGHTYRSTVAPMGARYLIPLSAENRNAAGAAAGDEIDVDVELDTQSRTVDVPEDLQRALDGDAAAKEVWQRLSYSHQRQHVLAIEQAKAAATRQRRIEKALAMLRGG